MKKILFIFSLLLCIPTFSFELEDLIGEWKEISFACVNPSNKLNLHINEEFIEGIDSQVLFDTRNDLNNPELGLVQINHENMTVESRFNTTLRDSNNGFCRARTIWSGSYSIQNGELAQTVDRVQNIRVIGYTPDDRIVRMIPTIEYPLLIFRYTKDTKLYKQEGCPKYPAEVSSGTAVMKFRVIYTGTDQKHLHLFPQSSENTCMGEHSYLHFKFRNKTNSTIEIHG